ncbi:unnamed protein product, partial [Leptidea sinapis]
VVIEAMKVCSRRLYTYMALVTHAYKPTYLVIDAAVKGLEVVLDIPLGDKVVAETMLTIKLMQKEETEQQSPQTPKDIFELEDE